MGSDIRVFSYDDLVFSQSGRKEEAAHVAVPLQLGKRRVLIDLSAAHYVQLAEYLEPYLNAGRKPDAAGSRSKSGRKPNAYYDQLRKFAADRGVTLTIDGTGKYTYPPDLRRDFEASLRE